MKIRDLKSIFFVILFVWISFFAPLVNQQSRLIFIFVIVILLSILFIFDKNSFKSIFNRAVIPFWIFLLTTMSGLRAVKDPEVAYDHFWSFIFHIPFLFFFTKSTFEERYGVLILRGMCVTALLVWGYGIIEFTTGQNFIYRYFVDNIFYDVFKTRRMISTHIHPAPLGSYFVAVFPLALALLLKENKTFFKLVSLLCIIIILSGIILTFSRGALIGLFAVISTITFFLLKQNKIFIILPLILLIAIIFLSSLLSYYDYNAFYRYSLQGLSEKIIYSRKIDRFIMMIQLLKEHPFFGVGFGQYSVLFDYYLPHLANFGSYDGKIADCMYITMLAETGLIGFGGFILFIYFIFKQVNISLKLRSENKLFLICFLSGFIGIMCTFLTYEVLYWTAPSYLFWGYAGILSYLARPKDSK